MSVKFYVNGVPVYRFVSKKCVFGLGKLAYYGDGLYGIITGFGMEKKSLAVHLQVPVAEFH